MAKLFIPVLVLLMAISLISTGCAEEEAQPPVASPSTPSQPPSNLVPNTPLDLYAYAKQDNPTVIPANMVNAPHDVEVESFAIWGATAEDDLALGMALTLTNASDASSLY